MNLAESVSVALSPESAKHLAYVAYRLLADLADNLGIQILAPADEPVDGAGHWIIGARLDPKALDLKLRAALRAKGVQVAVLAHE